MPSTLFVCGNEKCAYAIDSEALNSIQLKALRTWSKTCPQCQKQTKWTEQQSLLNTQTINDLGGSNEKSLSSTHINLPKTASQRRKAAGYDGH